MILDVPEVSADAAEIAIEKARDELNLSMQLLTKALDGKADGEIMTVDELKIIRQRRSARMCEAATRLNNLIQERRTR